MIFNVRLLGLDLPLTLNKKTKLRKLVHYYFFKKNKNKTDDGLAHGAYPVAILGF